MNSIIGARMCFYDKMFFSLRLMYYLLMLLVFTTHKMEVFLVSWCRRLTSMRVSYILCQESLSQGMGYQVFVVSRNNLILDTGDIPISPKMTESLCIEEEYWSEACSVTQEIFVCSNSLKQKLQTCFFSSPQRLLLCYWIAYGAV